MAAVAAGITALNSIGEGEGTSCHTFNRLSPIVK